MTMTHLDARATATQLRHAMLFVVALMTLLPNLGCAHQSSGSRRLQKIDPAIFENGGMPRPLDGVSSAAPITGSYQGKVSAAWHDQTLLAASRETRIPLPIVRGKSFAGAMVHAESRPIMYPSGLLAACWDARIPPPKLRLTPLREVARAGLPALGRGADIPRLDDLLAACRETRIPPPITLGLLFPTPVDPLLSACRVTRISPPMPPLPSPASAVPALVESRHKPELFASWD